MSQDALRRLGVINAMLNNHAAAVANHSREGRLSSEKQHALLQEQAELQEQLERLNRPIHVPTVDEDEDIRYRRHGGGVYE